MWNEITAAVSYAGEELQSFGQTVAGEFSIPWPLFSALINQESGWNPNAYNSSSGATGIAQFMPSTAAGFGINPWDPFQSLQAAAQYLSSLYQKFGSWPLALAAYNAGPGNVEKYGGIPPFPETQNYVQSIMAAAGGSSATPSTGAPSSGSWGNYGPGSSGSWGAPAAPVTVTPQMLAIFVAIAAVAGIVVVLAG